MERAEVLELFLLSLLLLFPAAAVAVAANNNVAAIGATIVAAVAAAATVFLCVAAVSTAVRSCCCFMLLPFLMLRLLPLVFVSFLLQLSEPRRVHQLPGVFTDSARAPHVLGQENWCASACTCVRVLIQLCHVCASLPRPSAGPSNGK